MSINLTQVSVEIISPASVRPSDPSPNPHLPISAAAYPNFSFFQKRLNQYLSTLRAISPPAHPSHECAHMLSGHQYAPGRSAYSGTGIEAFELHSLLGHLIQAWSLD